METDMVNLKFSWIEYTVVACMLLLSVLVGIYYTFFNKQKTFKDYMHGGKTMGVLPTFMSLVASYISGIALLGLPLEVYLYGTEIIIGHLASITAAIIAGTFFLPVYFNLQLDSIFQYLELRFGKHIRIVGVLLYTYTLLLFVPVVLFVPALAFNQVTDVPIHACTWIICICCLFYTTFGGLRAVMWTDTLQNMFTLFGTMFVVTGGLRAVMWTDTLQNMFTLFGTMFVVAVGCWRLGGVAEVLKTNEQGSRLELFNLDLDVSARNTVWTVVIGYTCNYLTGLVSNPGSVQRFLAVPSLARARWVLFCSTISFIVINTMCIFLGMILYTRYQKCDPVAAGVIKKANLMVPMYVMEIGKDYPGLAGLFMSGVMSAALSTLSSWLNTVGGTLYTDFMEVFYPKVKHSEAKRSTIIKAITVVLGLVCISMVVVVEKLGTIHQVAVSMLSLVNGTLLSLFTLGIFFPRVSSKGAIASTIVSLVVTGWVIINAQLYSIEGKLKFPGKVTSIDNCPASVRENYNSSTSSLFNYTGLGSPVVADSSVPFLYQLSYHYYSVLGTLTGIFAGLVVSFFTEPPDTAATDPNLFSPYVHRFLPKETQQSHLRKDEYTLAPMTDCKASKGELVATRLKAYGFGSEQVRIPL